MKNVLITGGSRGIGKALVKAFSEAGYSVAFTYNNSKKEAEELQTEFGALAIKADSRSESEVIEAVDSARKALGSIDILINNAGISSYSLFQDISLSEWNDTFSVNVGGAFLYSKAALPDMIWPPSPLPPGFPQSPIAAVTSVCI